MAMVSVDIDGLDKLESLLKENKELCKKLENNAFAIRCEMLQINAKINQPIAATND